jgi:serine/threonine-protein kinase
VSEQPFGLGEGATQSFHAGSDGNTPTAFFKGHDADSNFANLILRRRLLPTDVVQACMAKHTNEHSGSDDGGLADLIVHRNLLTREQADELLGILHGDDQQESLGGYQVIDRIGEGGMGTVYMAVQLALDRIVALKVLPEDLAADDPEYIERFMREAKVAGRIQHPNVVRAIDVGESNGKYYFAMEMVEGRSLQKILDERKRLPEEEALGIAIQSAQGLEAAWRDGLVHRDIKPDNILVTYDGAVKIADLGLARDTTPAATRLTQSGVALGTPHFISPEQGSTGDVDIRTDIFSLGVTLFRMVTGEFPWDGNNAFAIITAPFEQPPKNARRLNKAISRELEHIIEIMIAKDRDDRYPDPLVLLQDLRALAEGERPPFAMGKAGERTRAIEAAHASRQTATVSTTAFPSRRREKRPGPLRVITFGLVASVMLMGAGYLVRDRLGPMIAHEGRAPARSSADSTQTPCDALLRSAALKALRGDFDAALICCADASATKPAPQSANAKAIAALAREIERASHITRGRDAHLDGKYGDALRFYEEARAVADDDSLRSRVARLKRDMAASKANTAQ